MKPEHAKFIRENRKKLSMLDLSKSLGISYTKVRNYMIAENLMLSKNEWVSIRSAKVIGKPRIKKPWNWDALL